MLYSSSVPVLVVRVIGIIWILSTNQAQNHGMDSVFAQTYYPDQNSVGSGLDEIPKSHKSEAKPRLCINFNFFWWADAAIFFLIPVLIDYRQGFPYKTLTICLRKQNIPLLLHFIKQIINATREDFYHCLQCWCSVEYWHLQKPGWCPEGLPTKAVSLGNHLPLFWLG